MKRSRAWIVAALAAAVFWVALFTFGAARSDYSQLTKAVSELGAVGAPYWLAWNIVGFITPGLLLAVCGAGIATAFEQRRGALWWMLVASGVTFAGTGVFPAVMLNGSPAMQAPSTIGHVVMLLLSGLFWLIAAVLVVRRAWRDPEWRHLRTVAAAAMLLALAGLAANVFHDAIPQLAFRPGLAQRLGFVGHFLWFVLLSAGIAMPATRALPDPAERGIGVDL
jgi:hypothetical membrane protein